MSGPERAGAPAVDEVEILLVEDNPQDAEMTLRALRKQNIANRVHHAKDGAEALDFIFARGAYAGRNGAAHPRVILLDLKLPKVDGLEVLREVKGNAGTASIPVVIMTSSKEERDMVEGYRGGVNSFVVKPLDFEAFASAVANLGLYWLLVNRSPR